MKNQKEQSQLHIESLLNKKQTENISKIKQIDQKLEGSQNQIKKLMQQISDQHQDLEHYKITQYEWQSEKDKLKKTLKRQSSLVREQQDRIELLEDENNELKHQKEQNQFHVKSLLNKKQTENLSRIKQLDQKLEDSQNQIKKLSDETDQQQKSLENFQMSQKNWKFEEKKLKADLEQKSCLIYEAEKKIIILEHEKNQATQNEAQLFEDLSIKYQKVLSNNQTLQTENQDLIEKLAQSKTLCQIKTTSSEFLPEKNRRKVMIV